MIKIRAATLAEEQMSDPELIDGLPVLEKRPATDPRFPWVVLCELPEPEGGFEEDADRYVVWYVDRDGKPSIGIYEQMLDDALAAFESRT